MSAQEGFDGKKRKSGSEISDGSHQLPKIGRRRIIDHDDFMAKEDGVASVFVNEYRGWVVPHQNYEIPTILIDSHPSFTSEVFFREYVATRRPVVLRGYLDDAKKPFEKWNNEYLRRTAGNEKVMVEHRKSAQDSFGRGNEVSMTFSEFLDVIETGDSNHYLTTQDVLADDDGRPDLMAPFMKCLQADFPLRPKIVGSLVPQNINLWMGNSRDGASSGLHHDYHDNLYFVIRGTKRFHLFSPNDAITMKTRGQLFRIHANGRINYVGEPTTAYGADLQADAAAKAAQAKDMAEERLLKAEEAVEEGREGAEEELKSAEDQLEAAMEEMLDAEMNNSCDESDDGSGDDESSIEGENEIPEEQLFGTALGRRTVDKTVKDPDNFSTVKIKLDAKGTDRYPEISSNQATCEVREGDILYLPASWFHEVVSISRPVEKEKKQQTGHMALNYWFHPPDVFVSPTQPYSTDFWPNDFEQRLTKQASPSS